jgi:predicted lipoprotein
MNDNERRRRTVTAQGLAALALLVFAHGARAATVPAPAQRAAPGALAIPVTRPR